MITAWQWLLRRWRWDPQVEVEDADVVEKSYPAFWTDLEKVGFIPPAPKGGAGFL